MAEFRVRWEFDADATDPADAARQAWEAMRRDGSIANVFDVTSADGATTRVDLCKYDA